ncbi:glycine-rich RNA-binding protein 2, mitochondrial-like [Euphorbia lathyris]|uniref:glycine-rich RNA-binding protein 2, mitochondrial-like n=1 Tax=Euphorbia lathyris TaxID=212925 RepID=UPI00331409EC
MAFLSKVGNILKQTASRHINSELSVSRPSIYQAIRCMSSSKVFIGGISYATDDTSLREAFSKYGDVVEARVIVDRETGRSRGFGFVTYNSGEEASSAIQALDGQDLHGRRVRVNFANERARGGGGFGGGGGYGAGGYGAGGGGGYGGGSSYGSGGGGYGGGSNYGSGGGGYSGSGGYGGGGSYGDTGGSAGYAGGDSTSTGAYGSGSWNQGSGAGNVPGGNIGGGGVGSDFGSSASGNEFGVPGNTGFDDVPGNFQDDADDFAKRA